MVQLSDLDSLLVQLREAETDYRVAADYLTDPTLPLVKRGIWRRRARTAGRRYWKLKQEVDRLELAQEGTARQK